MLTWACTPFYPPLTESLSILPAVPGASLPVPSSFHVHWGAQGDAEDYSTSLWASSTQSPKISLLLWSAMLRCTFKIRQILNSVLPPKGTAASSFRTASSVLQGTGRLVSAPIQILKWKELKQRGQKRGEEGERKGEGAETLEGSR